MATRSETFHFEEFTLDVRERRLLRGTETVRLSPKAYDVLVALVRQRGGLVTKDELLKRLWPDSFVEEGSLNVYVSALRKALGEDARRPGLHRNGGAVRVSLHRCSSMRSGRREGISTECEGATRRTLRACRPRPVSPVV